MIRKLLIAILPLIAFTFFSSEKMSDNGRAGKTGSPGELFCTECHNSFAINSGGGSISLQSPGTPTFEYTPGITYNMSVTVAHATINLFGVGIEALTASNNNAGTLNITDAVSTQIKNALVMSVRQNKLIVPHNQVTYKGAQGSGHSFGQR